MGFLHGRVSHRCLKNEEDGGRRHVSVLLQDVPGLLQIGLAHTHFLQPFQDGFSTRVNCPVDGAFIGRVASLRQHGPKILENIPTKRISNALVQVHLIAMITGEPCHCSRATIGEDAVADELASLLVHGKMSAADLYTDKEADSTWLALHESLGNLKAIQPSE